MLIFGIFRLYFSLISLQNNGKLFSTSGEDINKIKDFIHLTKISFSASIYLVGCVIYWFFASGEVQPWAKTPNTSPVNSNGVADKNGKSFAYTNEAIEMKDESR